MRKPSFQYVDGYKVPKLYEGESKRHYWNRFKELNQKKLDQRYTEENQIKVFRRLKVEFNVKGDKNIRTTLIRKIKHSTEFKDYGDFAKDNVIQGLKKFNKYEQFMQMITKPNGKHRIDKNKLKYIGDGCYIYDNRVEIDFTNSPEDIMLILLENEEYEPKN